MNFADIPSIPAEIAIEYLRSKPAEGEDIPARTGGIDFDTETPEDRFLATENALWQLWRESRKGQPQRHWFYRNGNLRVRVG